MRREKRVEWLGPVVRMEKGVEWLGPVVRREKRVEWLGLYRENGEGG